VRETETMAPRRAEVLMLVPEVVRQIRQLRALGWGAKRIAGQTGVARATVRRYLRGGTDAETQRRPGAWTLEQSAQVLAAELLDSARRLYVRASLSQRRDVWREGLAGAFRQFGGVPQTLLLDNAGALVVGRDRATSKARLHPAFEAFCKDWSVEARVCQPYRA